MYIRRIVRAPHLIASSCTFPLLTWNRILPFTRWRGFDGTISSSVIAHLSHTIHSSCQAFKNTNQIAIATVTDEKIINSFKSLKKKTAGRKGKGKKSSRGAPLAPPAAKKGRGNDTAITLYSAIEAATYEAYTTADCEGGQGTVTKVEIDAAGMRGAWTGSTQEHLRVLALDPAAPQHGWPVDPDGRPQKLFVRKETLKVSGALFAKSKNKKAGESELLHMNAVILGTVGIGKKFMSSFLLWKILTEKIVINTSRLGVFALTLSDGAEVRFVLYTVDGKTTIFDKNTKTEAHFESYEDALNHYRASNKKKEEIAISLYCCSSAYFHPPLDNDVPTILFSPPDIPTYTCLKQQAWELVFANTWSEEEICAWSHCMGYEWADMWLRYKNLDGVPRWLLPQNYEGRLQVMKNAMDAADVHLIQRFDCFHTDISHPAHVLIFMHMSDSGKATNDLCNYTAQLFREKIGSLGKREKLRFCHQMLFKSF